MFNFIAESDIPYPFPNVFVIGHHHRLRLCLSGKRWREIQGKKGTVNMIGTQIGIVKDDDVIRSPTIDGLKSGIEERLNSAISNIDKYLEEL
jgi:hypothetical protein